MNTTTKKTIYQRFWEYHTQNPHVYEWFRYYAWEAKLAGYPYFSARTILHRLRWQLNVNQGASRFKISDHFSPHYGRLLMQSEPQDFANFFRTKPLQTP